MPGVRASEGMFWPIVAMVQSAVIVVLWVIPTRFTLDWTAIGAVATAAAAGVALWLGWREGAWRREEVALQRVGHAARYLPVSARLASMRHSVLRTRRAFKSADAYQSSVEAMRQVSDHLRLVSDIDLAGLTRFSSAAGRSLAVAIGTLRQVEDLLNLLLQNRDFPAPSEVLHEAALALKDASHAFAASSAALDLDLKAVLGTN